MFPIRNLVEDFATALEPRERLSLTAWSEAHFRLSREASAEPGKFHALPFQREVLETLSPDSQYNMIVLRWASQLGKSTVLLCLLGHIIDCDPGPVLLIEPTLSMAEAFSKDRLSPLFRDCEKIRGLVADPRSRDSGSTIFHRRFVNGHVTVIGANSPAGLASRPIRYLLCDETDRYEQSAGCEGDPISLALARTRTFHKRKVILTSSPTIPNSRIEQAWSESDRRVYETPCVHCGTYQRLEWSRVEYPPEEPALACYRCAHCQKAIGHDAKHDMVERGRWRATNPASKVAGFHLSELHSPWRSWAALAEEYEKARGNTERLRVFVNVSLAEVYSDEQASEGIEESLLARRELLGPLLPAQVAILTAGADVQGDRIEISVYGWSTGEEGWLVSHRKLMGDPGRPEVWRELDEHLLKPWPHPLVGPTPVHAAAIDCGFFTKEVLEFAEQRRGRRVYAVKGREGPRPLWPKKPSRGRTGKGPAFYNIGVDGAKSTLMARLKIESGPGRMHFPTSVGAEFFSQLCAEYLKTEYRRGRPVRRWVRRGDRRQAECLDTCVYSMAALAALQASGVSVDAEVARIALLAVPTTTPAEPARYEQTKSRWAQM